MSLGIVTDVWVDRIIDFDCTLVSISLSRVSRWDYNQRLMVLHGYCSSILFSTSMTSNLLCLCWRCSPLVSSWPEYILCMIPKWPSVDWISVVDALLNGKFPGSCHKAIDGFHKMIIYTNAWPYFVHGALLLLLILPRRMHLGMILPHYLLGIMALIIQRTALCCLEPSKFCLILFNSKF